MRKLFCLLVLTSAVACGKKESGESTTVKTADSTKIDRVKVDSVKIGAGEDLHGCKSSAGYTWSALKGECVRIFETGTRLAPYNDPTGAQMSAFVIFSGDKAEVFVQTEKPFILERKSEGEPFTGGSWQLIPWKGLVLKKNGTILFTGN